MGFQRSRLQLGDDKKCTKGDGEVNEKKEGERVFFFFTRKRFQGKLDSERSENEIDAAYFYRDERSFHFSRACRAREGALQATYACVSYLLKSRAFARNSAFNSIHSRQVTLSAEKAKYKIRLHGISIAG